jgi:hypothetical protein
MFIVDRDWLATVLHDQLPPEQADAVLAALGAVLTPMVTDPPPLAWRSAGRIEPEGQVADSVLRVHPDSNGAYYSLGPACPTPNADGERWSLELIQLRDEGHAVTDLGVHDTEQDAKDYAQCWEDAAIVECTWETVTKHRARIPLTEFMAAAQLDADPDDYVTPDAQLTPHALTGAAIGGIRALLDSNAARAKSHVVECRFSE